MSQTGASPDGERRQGGIAQAAERGFTAAFELVATPALFGVIGYFIDRWLGTSPIFTIVLTALVAVYVVWKLWYGYNLEMNAMEAERYAKAHPTKVDGSDLDSTVDDLDSTVSDPENTVSDLDSSPDSSVAEDLEDA